ncbi:hypothetical protein TNCV_2939911 [Trichonephila clavipes]|nr:hypothetical protein TNCV_2939911 [Trichonephila clavipes]
MPSCHSAHDLELAVEDLWAHLPQDNISPGSSTCASRVRSLNSDLHNILRYRSVESDLRVSLVDNGLVGPYSATVLVTLPSAPDHRPPRLESAR